ncbi:MAG TPA: serine/threonine-protein kinase [Casimicrobiaceae bacterium]|nr:serine/threonine-protein kinase [Casimicrobiaceae bacterium]
MAEGSIGKYEIRRELGRGAMGVVYEGYDPSIKRVVALKTIRADQLSGEQADVVIARFRREAQAAGRLNHPNIVSIYDFGEEGGVWYIAMELVQGRELKASFDADERFRLGDVVRIMGQILSALDYSHKQGVVHRDIKPANIFLLDDGSVKVADFGIAHIEASNLTQVGTVMGTPSYMSPEQIMGLPVDGRSDLFSAGVILYQFLTGERPFAGSAATTMQKVLKEDPLPPSTLNVQLPPALDAVVRKGLAKRADERYPTAQAFATALNAAASTAGAPMAATAVAAGVHGDATLIDTKSVHPEAAVAPGPATAAQRTGPSRVAMLPVAVVIAAVIAGAGAWYIAQRPAGGGATTAIPSATDMQPVRASSTAAPAAPSAASAAPGRDAGTVLITAVGLADPSDPRYQSDKALLQTELRADSRGQAVEKALGLLIDEKSISANYDLLRDRLLSKSASYVKTVLRESEPRLGKDGLMSITTEALVNVKAVQKSLNDMSRDERIDFIRAGGDPKISVQISVRDADQPGAPPLPSQVAENILKERIKSFGFRTWSETGGEAGQRADAAVIGEAQVKRLTLRLEASGLVVTKYALTSWTVKCIDRATGEEIYHNTALPKGAGSWASEEEALKAIGARVADEFSRDFFLQHADVASQPIVLIVEGMPDAAAEDLLSRELLGLPEVITASARPGAKPRTYDLRIAATGAPGDTIATGVLKPLNAKLGRACFTLGSVSAEQVSVAFDKRCAEASVMNRLETEPPAGLYGAPPGRQKTVIRNPETLRKITI